MSLSISKDQLIEVVSGRSLAAAGAKLVACGVETDSREVRGGELFIALKGEKNHGHEFLPQAFERGAALYLVESEAATKSFPEPERLVLVPDTLAAFWTLARWWRRRLKLPVLAITGSVGKTTVKEIAASILLQHSKGAYSQKSFNNHVGVPHTICRIAPDHEWAVLEMGMNHAGEIRRLTSVGEPNVAAINVIAPAHIEFLGSMENIARAKLEITAGLPQGAPLVLNGCDPVLVKEAAVFAEKYKLLYFGEQSGRVVPALDAEVSAVRSAEDLTEGITFALTLQGETTEVKMHVVGEHNAGNAACAALCARCLRQEITLAQIKKGLEAFRAPLQRLNLKDLSGGRKLLDDAYNANPASMQALLRIGQGFMREGRQVGVIWGDMLELGAHAEGFHREVGRAVAELKPAFLVTVGPYARFYRQEAEKAAVKCLEAAGPELAAHIAMKLGFDILLVKASRGMRLDKTVAVVLEREGV